MLYYKDIHNFV